MVFVPKTWENSPSTNTPITAAELNRLEAGIVEGTRAATETQTGNVELATDVEMAAGTDLTRAPSVKRVFDYVATAISGIAVGQVGAASETAAGVVELATAAEVTVGTDLTRAVSPKRLVDYVTTAIAGLGGTGGTAAAPLSLISTAIGMIPLSVKGFAGQTADLFRAIGSDNVVLASIDSAGQITAGASFTASGMFKALNRANIPAVRLREFTGQTSNIFVIENSLAANVMTIAADGTVNGKNVGTVPGTNITYSPTLVLDAAAPVPTDTPVGTVILRRPA